MAKRPAPAADTDVYEIYETIMVRTHLHASQLPTAYAAPSDALPSPARPPAVSHDPAPRGYADASTWERARPRAPAPATNAYAPAGMTALSLRAQRDDHIYPPYGSAAWHRLMDEETNSVARPGNAAVPLVYGLEAFGVREDLIERARHHIHLQTFIFSDDETSRDLAERLARKAREGVRVRLLLDGLGSSRACDDMLAMMREAGVEIRLHAPPAEDLLSINNRRHEKILLVDGDSAVTGGMNVGDEYALGGSGRLVLSRGADSTEPWRDTDLLLRGPSVQDLQRAFLKNWNELGPPVDPAEYPKVFPPTTACGTATTRVVHHRPVEDGDQNTTNLYYHAIMAARQSVVIENAYLIPPPLIKDALIQAAKRGVNVTILTNSAKSSDLSFVAEAGRYHYDELIAAGVRIFEKTGGTLHSKTMACDGVFSIVGSVNLNGRSHGCDSEVAVATLSPPVAKTLERTFQEGLAEAKEVTAQELAEESFFTNAWQWTVNLMSNSL